MAASRTAPLQVVHGNLPLPKLWACWQQEQPVGCGLENLQNSCFLNAVLQCLAHIPVLGNLCLARAHSHQCPVAAGGGWASCVACQLEAQLAGILARAGGSSGAVGGGGRVLDPRALVRCLPPAARLLVSRGRQEDAHELLRCLVDALERSLLPKGAAPSPRQPNTLASAIFGGLLQSGVSCHACGRLSTQYEPLMDVSLELRRPGCSSGTVSSLVDALSAFIAPEVLDGDNKYRCDGCSALVVAEKRLLLWDEPNVLVLHVKRFSYDGAKLGAHLAFSTQLNLVPYMCPRRLAARRTEAHVQHRSGARRLVSPQVAAAGGGAAGAAGARAGAAAAAPTAGCGSPQYELVGLVVHRGGSLSSGHYVAYVKDGLPPSGYWHCCDDTQVYRVSEATVLSQQAYLLFYARTSIKLLAQLPVKGEAQPSKQLLGAKRAAGELMGPQLPPQLQLQRQQQQQQRGAKRAAFARDVAGSSECSRATELDMFAHEQEDSKTGSGRAERHSHATQTIGPQLPPASPTATLDTAAAAAAVEPAGDLQPLPPAVAPLPSLRPQPSLQQVLQQVPEADQRQWQHVSTPSLRAVVECAMAAADSELRPLLRAELRAARRGGLSAAQSKSAVLGRLRAAPRMRRVAAALLQQLIDLAAGPAAGSGKRGV